MEKDSFNANTFKVNIIFVTRALCKHYKPSKTIQQFLVRYSTFENL